MTCRIDHTTIKTSEDWHALELAGRQYLPADDFGPELAIELRNCVCGSTLARPVEPTDDDRETYGAQLTHRHPTAT